MSEYPQRAGCQKPVLESLWPREEKSSKNAANELSARDLSLIFHEFPFVRSCTSLQPKPTSANQNNFGSELERHLATMMVQKMVILTFVPQGSGSRYVL